MMKNLIFPCIFLTCVTAFAEDKHGWYADAKKPGTVDLWLGEKLVGTMDPFDGTWQFSGRNKVEMRKWVYENNPPKNAGALLKDEPESERDKLKREINERKLKEAGIDPAKNSPILPKPSEKPKAGIDETTAPQSKCKCSECKCKDGKTGADCTCENCECAIVVEQDKIDNGPKPLFGVSRNFLGFMQDRWSVCGVGSTKVEAMSRLSAGASDVPDDIGVNRITVIGSVAARQVVMADLAGAPTLSYWKDKFIVKEYLPTHWRIESGGFEKPKSIDKAVVYVQAPDGKVLFRCDEWKGPDPFAKELRDRVPGYDPSKDPGYKGADPVDGGLLEYWRLAVLAGAVGFVGYSWRKSR